MEKEKQDEKEKSEKNPKKKKGGAGKAFRFLLKKWQVVIVVAAILVLAIAGGTFVIGKNTMITKENTVTSSLLEDAISVSDLSVAEFVYNGIASKYAEGKDDPEYSIAYQATCKSGISMSEISFDVDEGLRIVYPHFPEPSIISISVDINSLEYLPEDPDIDMKEVIELCENDVREGADGSTKFKETALDNLRDVIEALTMPLLVRNGYTIEWGE